MVNFKKQGTVKTLDATILAPQHGNLKFVLSVARVDGKQENPMMNLFLKRWASFKKDLAGIYFSRTGEYKLGYVAKPLVVQSDVWIMHCVCIDEKSKLNLNAFKTCVQSIRKNAEYENASIHVSNILVSLYPKISKILEDELIPNGINIVYYNEPNL